jgi:3-methyl-2-oxobutanoate hydroxymethyltransferase
MYRSDGSAGSPVKKVTVPEIRARKEAIRDGEGKPLAMLTAYDYTMARLLDMGGADMLLVGDSLGMVVQGHTSTLPVTLDEICYHTRAVARGARRAHVVGDMPFMSFQVSAEKALESAGKLMKDGSAESVKLEGGIEVSEHVFRIVSAGIPVVGHVGLLPQSVHAMGGFKVQGRGHAAARILADARALEEAGAFALVLEAIPPDVAQTITDSVSIPTIGIGAGAGCDGQVLVSYDMLGMYQDASPSSVRQLSKRRSRTSTKSQSAHFQGLSTPSRRTRHLLAIRARHTEPIFGEAPPSREEALAAAARSNSEG